MIENLHPAQIEIQRAVANWYGPIDVESRVVIGTPDLHWLVSRFAFHRPPSGEEVSAGIRAYINRNVDGSNPAIEAYFGHAPTIVWLSPTDDKGPRSIRVDLSLLDPANLRRTGQAEGYLWHLGEIPAAACFRR